MPSAGSLLKVYVNLKLVEEPRLPSRRGGVSVDVEGIPRYQRQLLSDIAAATTIETPPLLR